MRKSKELPGSIPILLLQWAIMVELENENSRVQQVYVEFEFSRSFLLSDYILAVGPVRERSKKTCIIYPVICRAISTWIITDMAYTAYILPGLFVE